MGPLHPRREVLPCSPAELRAQRTLQAAEQLVAQPGSIPPMSVEHELREYMREMKLKSYGHAGSLLSSLYRTS